MIPRPPRSTRLRDSFPTRRSSYLLRGGANAEGSAACDGSRAERRQLHADGKPCRGALHPLRREARRIGQGFFRHHQDDRRSEEHTSELQSLMRISFAVFCLKKKNIDYMTLYSICLSYFLNI